VLEVITGEEMPAWIDGISVLFGVTNYPILCFYLDNRVKENVYAHSGKKSEEARMKKVALPRTLHQNYSARRLFLKFN
jgi:hypothetical protein